MNECPKFGTRKEALDVGIWVFPDAAVSRTDVRSQPLLAPQAASLPPANIDLPLWLISSLKSGSTRTNLSWGTDEAEVQPELQR